MSTGEIVGVAVGVTALAGTVLFVLHRQNQAALQAQVSAQAAAARAAASARHNDFDLGKLLTDLGGTIVDKGIGYAIGGPAGVLAMSAAGSAVQV